MAITGTPATPADEFVDLLTVAEAQREPLLADLEDDDARLLQLITACSSQIQHWLGREYEDTTSVPADVKLACSMLLSYRWTEDDIVEGGDMESESLGQYSYNRRNQVAVQARLTTIMNLLRPHRLCAIPVSIHNTDTTATLAEDED